MLALVRRGAGSSVRCSTIIQGYNNCLLLRGFDVDNFGGGDPKTVEGFSPPSSFSIDGDEHAVGNEVGNPRSDGVGADPQDRGLLLRREGDHGRAGGLQRDLGHEPQPLVEGHNGFRELPPSA